MMITFWSQIGREFARRQLMYVGLTTIGVLALCLFNNNAARGDGIERFCSSNEKSGGSLRCGVRQTASNLVRIDTGWLLGAIDGESHGFKGIPYAAPPVGTLRWRPPRAPRDWRGLRRAQVFSSPCPQVQEGGGVRGAEDCLYLNVWIPVAPQSPSPLPVIVFLHGGGNVMGSASETIDVLLDVQEGPAIHGGAKLAARGDVVVVTLNYRLAGFGFLAHPAFLAQSPTGSVGNYGLMDQIAGLEWVQRNITAFGGDPERVLLSGQSGGAYDVCALLASPTASGLFSRAVIQSGICTLKTPEEIRFHSRALAEEVGCADASNIPECLRAVPMENIVLAKAARPLTVGNFPLNPSVDGYIVPDQPDAVIERGEHNNMPFVIGNTAEELADNFDNIGLQEYIRLLTGLVAGHPGSVQEVFALYSLAQFSSPTEAVVAAFTDATFRCPARTYARLATTNQVAPVFRFHFERILSAPERLADGAYHGTDLLFLFQHMDDVFFGADDDDRVVETLMLRYWTRFAATGDPNGGADPLWPEYEVETDSYQIIDVAASAGQQLFPERCDFWDRLGTTVALEPGDWNWRN